MEDVQVSPRDKIYFIFPYKGVGGVSVLFYRLAKFLTENQLAVPVLVDYADGTMIELTKEEKIDIDTVIYSDEHIIKIPENSYVVFQSMTPWSIFPNVELHANTRILFWNCHPYNLVLFIPFFRFITYRFKRLNKLFCSIILREWSMSLLKFIDVILHNRALVFMDQENLRNTSLYNNIEISNCNYLPIPVEVDNRLKLVIGKNINGVLNFSWIGRIVDFKYYPLKRIMLDLDTFASKNEYKINLNIVGTGPYLDKIKILSKQLDSLDVSFKGDLSLSDVRDLITNNTNIVLAMGTSALEGGALGVPTILLDFAYKEISPSYRYKWLYQTKNFNLAEEVTLAQESAFGESLEKLLEDYLAEPKKISDNCYLYILENHSLEVVSNLFLKYLSQTKLTGKQIKSFQRNGSIGNFLYKKLCSLRLKLRKMRLKS